MRNRTKGRRQRGYTLPELLIGGTIGLFVAAMVTYVLMQEYFNWRGRAEGERVVNALTCGLDKARAMGSTGSATSAVLINNGCFGRDPKIANRGAAAATLQTSLVATQNYVVGQCNVIGTNDGLYIETKSGNDECVELVKGASARGADIVSVVPSGGSAAVVKALGATVDLGTAALTTACYGTAPVAVRACSRM